MAGQDILLGPILGYEWDETAGQAFYTVIVRISGTGTPLWVIDTRPVIMQKLRALHDGSCVWRGEIALPAFDQTLKSGRTVTYRIQYEGALLRNQCGDSEWRFHLPGRLTPDQQPRIAFCTCNGFSNGAVPSECEPLHLWQHMQKLHAQEPFSLLIMGGDQLYCDDLARQKGSLGKLWAWLNPEERAKLKPNAKQLDKDYFDHYVQCWACYEDEASGRKFPHAAMVQMMASVPSVMMWDDHDIFDGWGSYQAKPENMPYHVEAYHAARAAFEVYQIRGAAHNRSLLERKQTRPSHYSQGLQFGAFHILLLDNRSHRTPHRIMDNEQWKQVIQWLKKHASQDEASQRSLLVVSPVPLVYRRFEDWVSELPVSLDSEDDLLDHWNHRNHQGERNRLVSHLFDALCFEGKRSANHQGFARVTLLSGDVHIGALGFLERTDTVAEIAQVISSGIVHPAPGPMAWRGICAISHDDDYHIQGQSVVAKMAPPVGAGFGENKYLRCRNFAWLKLGNDNKLWINWECEEDKSQSIRQMESALR